MRTVVRGLAQALKPTLTAVLTSAVLASAVVGPMTWVAPSVAHAQATPSAANKARARELYTQGQQLFRQGDFTTAQRSFEEAYRAVPNPVVLLSIAECQVRAEQYNAAVGTLRLYLREKPGAPDRSQVESQIATLEAKPGVVTVESLPTGATIWVDGENTGYITPNDISIRSGRHTISLAEQGYQSTEQSIEVEIGSRQRVNLTLTPEPPAVISEEPLPPTAPVEEPSGVGRSRHANAGVWTTMAIAGAAGITGAVLGGFALHKVKEYNDHPSKSIADKGNRLALFADVNFGICAAAAVTSLVLYLTSGHSETPTVNQAFMVAPEFAPGEVGLNGQMRF